MPANSDINPIRIWISGITGRMGKALIEEVTSTTQFEVIGGTDAQSHYLLKSGALIKTDSGPSPAKQTNLIIDFSSELGNAELYKLVSAWPHSSDAPAILIATTGLSEEACASWKSYARQKSPVLLAPNTSLGVLTSLMASKKIASILKKHGYDIEVVETHHKHKVDSPSGTALLFANSIAAQENLEVVNFRSGKRRDSELGVTAIRGGQVFGEHEIRFFGEFDEVTISHKATSRRLFAQGALKLAGWLHSKGKGFLEIHEINLEDLS